MEEKGRKEVKGWRPKEGWNNPEKGKPDLHYGRNVISTEKIYEAGADAMHEADVEEIEKHFVGKKVWHEGHWCYLLLEKFWENFKATKKEEIKDEE